MPRGIEAASLSEQQRYARWRFLLRHPEFRAALNGLRGVSEHHIDRCRDEWLERWGVNPVSIDTAMPLLTLASVPYYEAFGQRYGEALLRAPVRALFGKDEDDNRWNNTPDEHLLFLEIDLTLPADQLVALAEQEIKAACAERGNRQRRRRDKIDGQLAVFDRRVHGEPFRAIARHLGRRVSTVKSTFAVAWRNVFGPNAPPSTRRGAVKAGLGDPSTHRESCPECQATGLCDIARRYVASNHTSQRALLGWPDTFLPHLRSATAPKEPLPGEVLS